MFKYFFYIKKIDLICSTTQVNDILINYSINQIYINYHHVENRPAHIDGFMGFYIYIIRCFKFLIRNQFLGILFF